MPYGCPTAARSPCSRFTSLATRPNRHLPPLRACRVNLPWGSNTIIQVAAGYADVAIEFAKGFATYDLLPGLYNGMKTGLTILDLSGHPLTAKLDIDQVFTTFHSDAQHPQRTAFIAAKDPALAEQVLRLLKRK